MDDYVKELKICGKAGSIGFSNHNTKAALEVKGRGLRSLPFLPPALSIWY